MSPASLPFPADDTEASERFKAFCSDDPFDGIIPAALLNSADIYDYVRVTGMLHPFDASEKVLEEKLKGASYEIDFLGDVYSCPDDETKLKRERIEKDCAFTLKKNSIAFVYLKTVFRLPHYIAVRFNLRITHVHRGLLLGTGPLVDPGFVGQLLIPLHNLTSKDYTLIGGEGLIWAEFTKTSPLIANDARIRPTERKLFTILERKIKLDARAYFNRASEGVPARSSIPQEVSEAKRIAEGAAAKVNTYTWGAVIAGTLTALGLISATWSLISVANKNVADSSKVVVESRKSFEELSKDLEELRAQVNRLQMQAAKEKSPGTQPQLKK